MNGNLHHPSQEMLASFAACSLPMAQFLGVAVHLEHCDKCRNMVASFASLGGNLFAELEPVAVSPSFREDFLSRVLNDNEAECEPLGAVEPVTTAEGVTSFDVTQEALRVFSAPASQVRSSRFVVPDALKRFIPKGFDELRWNRASLSLHSHELAWDESGHKVELVKIRPGGAVATHTHLGEEYTVVLNGSFSDEDGLYREGDFIVRDASHKHTPIATRDEECICLTITQAPIQLTGWLTRWLNPILRRRYFDCAPA